MSKPMSESAVLVELHLVDLTGNQPIGMRSARLVDLASQEEAIEKALSQVGAVLSGAAAKSEASNGFRVEEIEASFSLTLAAEGALIVAKASAEATLSVTLTAKRVAKD
jgi:hypothetical protein